ncbi:MAG: YkgJ family cysteine cluster protein [Limisphaerales bacterium]
MTTPAESSGNLCLHCGLCCDGTLFRDVELQPGDDAEKLRALGLPVTRCRREEADHFKFPQPCRALCADLRCRVYADRPARCRQFECALFKAVAGGTMASPAALKIIRQTRQQAETVCRLLRELGDAGERVSLARRFKRLKRKFDAGEIPSGLDTETAYDRFAELSLAVHELDMRLRTKFYPDPSDG